ncbi:MAG: glycosyltransferase [Chitinispirillales bacterium]|jgi:GT2 family glycosyltransferase|nr:glycosyltransferase [Chitinispirillales bacterium]
MEMNNIKLSIIIVNYKVRDFLMQAIRSIVAADNFENCEIVVVDNKSEDGSKELINKDFPFVKYVELKTNHGFGKACNIGAGIASGEYLLMLNPDTMISKNTLSTGIDFLEKNKDVGILGPKILNQDGSFQFQCRRSFPTPLNAFCYISGLSKIFPKNKLFGSYNLSWISPDDECDIDAASGACFFITKNLFLQVGGFDESFFMYGEDLDLSAKVKDAGFRVHYTPQTKIVHFKGRSSTSEKLKSRINFYEAMILFSKKHNKRYGSFFPKWALNFCILIMGGINISGLIIRNSRVFFIDLFFANAFLPIFAFIYSVVPQRNFIYSIYPKYAFFSHLILTFTLIVSLGVSGHYGKPKPEKNETIRALAISLLLLFAFYYLFQEVAFSRIIIFSSGLLSAISIVYWRTLVSPLSKFYKKYFAGYGSVILLAEEPFLSVLVSTLDDRNTQILGIISTVESSNSTVINGYEVIGNIQNLSEIIKKYSPDTLVIGSKTDWYSTIIKALSDGKLDGISVFWLPPDSDLSERLKLKNFMKI